MKKVILLERKNNVKKIALTIFVSVTLYSCKKYEEDKGVQLSSAKHRIAREWVIVAYYENEKDQTTYFNTTSPNYSTVFSKDGNFKTHAEGSYSIGTYQVPIEINEAGQWYFAEKKNNLLLSTNNTSQEFKILKLSKTELWLLELNIADKIEYHFKAK